MSLLIAILGNKRVGEAFSFHRCFTEGGTNLWHFFNYVQNLMDCLDNNQTGCSFLFTVDNLNFHRHLVMTNLIYARVHRVVFRVPYWFCGSAIEYIFNTLQTRLQMEINGMDTVLVIEGMPSFKRYFLHMGFPDNHNFN